MISKRDSKPILIKFPIGVSKNNKTTKIYEDNWNVVYGLISEPSGSIESFKYGNDFNYDIILVFNAGNLTRKINYDSLVLIENMPTDTFKNGDYEIKYIFPEYNGQIKIGLNKIQGVNIPKIYFYRDETLLYFQLNFDFQSNNGYINSKQNIPFQIGQYVWNKEPENNSQTENRLVFSSQNRVGFDNSYKPFTQLVFESED